SVPAQHVEATSNGWIPERDFAKVNDVPLWKAWAPRLGVAWDMFGDGKTAVKMALGRYVQKNCTGITLANNPITTSINTVTRVWNDANGNYIPDCSHAKGE